MKACAFFIFILFSATGYSQNTINGYRYVLVPEKFDFLKANDQYELNTTTRLLLEKKGFSAFVGNAGLPPTVAANKCNALIAEVSEKNSLFVTKLILVLKDCQGNILFKSKEGKSREKEFQTAYSEALKDAFSSLNAVAYKYDSTIAAPAQQVAAIPAQQVTSTSMQPVAAASATPVPVAEKLAVTETTGTLYAQPTATGYQLIDTSPKKIMTLLKTSIQDYFIAEAGASNGIVFKRDGEWFFEHYEDKKLVSQKLEIKF